MPAAASDEHNAFSLLTEPWLPVRRADGRRDWVRPAAVAAPDIVDFNWGRPDFDAAAREFMIGLLATACRDRLVPRWRPWSPTVEELDGVFAPLAEAFVLDGSGDRFMQDRERVTGEAVPVSQLLIEAPGANTVKRNLDHFVRRGGVRVLSRAAAAMALFTLQDFAPSGGAGHRTSLRGGGPLTTLVRPGDEAVSLWQRLWLNAIVPEGGEEGVLARVFPWTAPTRVSDAGQVTTPSDGHPLQVYWGMPRRIRLEFSVNVEGAACDLTGLVDPVVVTSYVTRPYGTNYAGWIHPLSPHYRAKGDRLDWLPVHGQPGRIGYRHYVGLIAAGRDALRRPADVVGQTKVRLGRRAGHRARIDAAGYDMDNMKARDFIESSMPFLLFGDGEDGLERDVLAMIECLIGAADLARRLLSQQLRAALFGRDPPDGGALALARETFWQVTEGDFWTCVARLVQDRERAGEDGVAQAEALTNCRLAWSGALRKAALDIFDRLVPAAGFESLRQSVVVRIVGARKHLSLGLHGYGKDGAGLFKALGIDPPKGKGAAA